MGTGRNDRVGEVGHELRAGESVHCQECGRRSDARWRGWRAYRTDDPELDEPPALAFFCPACSRREFGGR
jgi:hypothetical protein